MPTTHTYFVGLGFDNAVHGFTPTLDLPNTAPTNRRRRKPKPESIPLGELPGQEHRLPKIELPNTRLPPRAEIETTFGEADRMGQSVHNTERLWQSGSFNHDNDTLVNTIAEKDQTQVEFNRRMFKISRQLIGDNTDDNRRLMNVEAAFEISRDSLADYNV